MTNILRFAFFFLLSIIMENKDIDLELLKILSELAQLPNGLKLEDIIEME